MSRRALMVAWPLLLLAAAPVRAADDPELPPGAPAALKDEVRRTYRVLLHGKRCYLASTVGVVVADCADPARLKYLGALALPDSVNDLCIVGGRLAIANGPSGVVMAELGDRPRLLGRRVLSGAAMGLAAVGKRLLVATGTAGLHLLDPTDPRSMRPLDHWETSGYARDVRVQGDLIALADGSGGVHAFRLVKDRLHHLSSASLPGGGAHAFALAFWGKRLLVAAGPSGMVVIEAADPGRLRVAGAVAVRDAARGVAVRGRRAAVADGTAGVALVDLADPRAPVETGRIKTERAANRVLLDGELLYVANDYDGLLVVRVPAKGDPVVLGRLPAPKGK